jgi:hypothetical protein
VAGVRALLRQLAAERARRLDARPVRSIAASIGRLSRRWMNRSDFYRKKAVRRLVSRSGFSEGASNALLDSLFLELTEKKLMRLLRSELGDPAVLDRFRAAGEGGVATRARGPEVIFHVFAANIPNPAIVSFVLGMLVKSANAGKVSSRDPGILDIYLESLKRSDADLARTNAIVPAGPGTLEKGCAEADLIVAYGSDATLDLVKRLVPAGRSFHGYGHRVSFGLFAREALTRANAPALAKKTARDVWMADQRGCLSPVVVFAQEGGETSPAGFAAQVAASLKDLWRRDRTEHDLFGRAASIEAEKAARAVRFLRRRLGAGSFWESRPRGRWIVYHDDAPGEFPFSSGNQAVHVKSFSREEEVFRAIAPFGRHLQAVAVEAGARERRALAAKLAALGANRVCRAGRMQRPPLTWHHDGRPNLSSWVSWTDLEA